MTLVSFRPTDPSFESILSKKGLCNVLHRLMRGDSLFNISIELAFLRRVHNPWLSK